MNGKQRPRQPQDQSSVIHLEQNAPIEIFAFVTSMHREVVLRHLDNESQDIELTPNEADHLAELLKEAATRARNMEP